MTSAAPQRGTPSITTIRIVVSRAPSRRPYASPERPARISRSARLPGSIVPSLVSHRRMRAASRVAMATSSRSSAKTASTRVDETRDLQLPEEVLAAARRPVGAQPDRQAGGFGLNDLRRVSIQQEVAERRPHHRGSPFRQDIEVGPLKGHAVNARKRGRDGPVRPPEMKGLEVFTGGRVGSLGQVKQETRAFLESVEEGCRVGGLDVADPRAGRWHAVDLAALDIAHDALEEGLCALIAEECDALGGRDTGEQTLCLHVAHDRLDQTGRASQDGHRPADVLPVDLLHRAAGPAVAIVESLRYVPQRQDVVGQVVVKLDEPGEERSPCPDDRGVLEALRYRPIGGNDWADRSGFNVDDSSFELGEVLVHRYDAAFEAVGAERVDGRGVTRHRQGSDVGGACQTSVWRMSSTGRSTDVLRAGSAVRRHASSPRNVGTPNGRSRPGMAA